MTQEELVTKQALQIERYKQKAKHNKKLREALHAYFYSIGAPLNDNVLNFNKEQRLWLAKIASMCEEIES